MFTLIKQYIFDNFRVLATTLSVTTKITPPAVPSVRNKVVQVTNLVHTVSVMPMVVSELSTTLPMLSVTVPPSPPTNQVLMSSKIQLPLTTT